MENVKNIVELRNWIMYPIRDRLSLSGTADNHPKLGRNIDLANTSTVLSIEENKQYIMTCRTHNTVYKLDWRTVNLNPKEYLAEPSELNCAETVRDKYILYLQLVKARNKKPDEINAALRQYMSVIAEGRKQYEQYCEEQNMNLISAASKYNNCIYMDISSISKGNNIAFNINGKTGVVKPSGTSGYFVNTIEYESDESQGVDVQLSYFIGQGCIDISQVSSNVENIVVHNNKLTDLIINGSYKVRFDETIMIETSKLLG